MNRETQVWLMLNQNMPKRKRVEEKVWNSCDNCTNYQMIDALIPHLDCNYDRDFVPDLEYVTEHGATCRFYQDKNKPAEVEKVSIKRQCR